MKKIIIACALFTTVSGVSFAQSANTTMSMEPSRTQAAPSASPARLSDRGTEKIAEDRARVHQKQLGLTQEQYKGVYAAELQYAQQEAMMKPNGGVTAGQAYQWNMGRDQQIKNSVTPAQYAKYEAAKTGTAK